MLLPPDVVPEDIISIQGQHVALESKQMIASVNSSEYLPQELEKQWIDLEQQRDVLFLDSWEVKDKEKENKVFSFFCWSVWFSHFHDFRLHWMQTDISGLTAQRMIIYATAETMCK